MAEREEIADLFRRMGQQISGLSTTLGAQGVAKVIPSFEGDSRAYKYWMRDDEKYAMPISRDSGSIKFIFYQSANGPVSYFLMRHFQAHPYQTWDENKKT